MPVIEKEKMVSEYVQELAKIVDARKELYKEVEHTKVLIATTRKENQLEILSNKLLRLEKEVDKMNVLGRGYIQKIEKINGFIK